MCHSRLGGRSDRASAREDGCVAPGWTRRPSCGQVACRAPHAPRSFRAPPSRDDRMTIAHAAQRRPQPGELAPDVTLRSTSGESVRLADFHGKKHVLVAFFPLAFTSVCTAELCAFSEDFDQFASEDVVV